VTAEDLARPDRLVIDLDPLTEDPTQVRDAARKVRALLDELGIASVPVASGGKGYHVYVALVPTAEHEDVSRAALILANALAHRFPDALTIETLKKNRNGRVYVDWLRNTWGATVIAPYSLRARAKAPVAVPITWDELDDVAPSHFTIATVPLDREDPLLTLAAIDASDLCLRTETLYRELKLDLIRYDRFGRPMPLE
jgi:bifunctional non-homologous end joining protein LigD